jgi:transcription initiation factor TFIIH subunit 2
VTLVIDLSLGSLNLEMPPNRGVVIKNLLSKFVVEFAEQNPLSKLAIIVTYKEQATLLTWFDDTPDQHIAEINKFNKQEGYPSL